MPLLRTVARTAVVAGTATHVSNNVSRRQAGRWAQQQEAQAYEQQQAYAQQQPVYAQPAPAAAPAAVDPTIEQLQQLASLQAQGVITAEEFAAAKAKLLGI